MSPNNGILLNSALRPKLLNIPFASCSFINLDFLLPHTAHFDNNIAVPFVVFKAFEFTFSVFFLHFKQWLVYEMFRNNIIPITFRHLF